MIDLSDNSIYVVKYKYHYIWLFSNCLDLGIKNVI
jgi:hypothetical protein